MNKKTYILDTNVLIDDPKLLENLLERGFEDTNFIMPITTLEELDKLKKASADLGKRVRTVVRSLDAITEGLDAHLGIDLSDGNSLLIDVKDYDCTGLGDPLYGDTRILAMCIEHGKQKDVVLLTNDIAMRVRARVQGIKSESYKKDKSEQFHVDTYPGYKEVNDPLMLEKIIEHGEVDPSKYDVHLDPNEGVLFKNDEGEVQTLARLHGEDSLRVVKTPRCFGIVPKNNEQALAMNLMLDKDIQLVTLSGMPGTGKSLISIATALELVLEKKEYQKLVIYRPMNVIAGQEVGFLKGLLSEKVSESFGAVMDSFEVLLSKKAKKLGKAALPGSNRWKEEVAYWQEKGILELSPITFVRGRSLSNSIVIIDEFQNFTKEDAKTLLTRIGENTKVIATGDLEQIDTKNLDANNNALIHVVNHFQKSKLAAHVTLVEGQRSELAKEAALYL